MGKWIEHPFAGPKINSGRQTELDIARALAVVFMVFVHIQMYFSKEELVDSFLGMGVDFMGGVPAAPVFMFLMGVGFLYSRKTDYRLLIQRGVKVLAVGYLLNFLREALPELVDYCQEGDSVSLSGFIESFIDIDILQFAGLAMIFFGWVKCKKLSVKQIALLGIVFPLMNICLLPIQCENYCCQAFTGLFWGSSEYAEFPFLTWIFYPITGYLFANILIRCKDKFRFYKQLLINSGVLLILSLLVLIGVFDVKLGMNSEIDYYHHTFIANIIYLLFCLFWISLLYLLFNRLPEAVMCLLRRWSSNVTEIYFVHWIIIGWLSWYFYEIRIAVIPYFLLCIFVFVVSDKVAMGLVKRGIRIA